MAPPRFAFERRTGSGVGRRQARLEGRRIVGPVDPYARERWRGGELARVRAYLRGFPHPPGYTRHPNRLHVRGYYRRKGVLSGEAWVRREHQNEWVRYLADYYHVSRSAARRMERESRP
jgi:hypothetical protein